MLYLPPYSPDFNPIENAFAKVKALLRKAASVERIVLDESIEAISATNARTDFRAIPVALTGRSD